MTADRTFIARMIAPFRAHEPSAQRADSFNGPTELSDSELAQVVGGPSPYCHHVLFEGRFCYLGRDSRYPYGPYCI